MITGGKYIYIFISKIYIFASSYCIMNRSDNNGRERLDMEYESLFLENLLTVQKLYSVHYFEYMKDFVFAGESHDFWEFVCVDKGEVNIITDKSEFLLKKDELLFHKPNEFHGVKSNGRVAPNLVVMSFECLSPAMFYLSERVLTIGENERHLLALILAEARNSFSTPLDDPYLKKIERSDCQRVGSEQLIRIYLEQLLLLLIRQIAKKSGTQKFLSLPLTSSTGNSADIDRHIIAYLEANISLALSVEQICCDNLIAKSKLQRLFRERYSCGVMEYFSHMKINHAKQLIRNKDLNYTQIAEALGYNSIHYFSRHFKNMTGMSPSEYASSIKKISEERPSDG